MFPSLGFLVLSQLHCKFHKKFPDKIKKFYLLINIFSFQNKYCISILFRQCKNRSRADFVIVTASMGEVGISLCSSLVILPKNCPYSFFVSPVKWDGIAGGKRTLVG